MEEGQSSRFDGADQPGWGPDVDAEHQEPNDSAHRSFEPGKYAPAPGPGREKAAEEEREVPGDTVESTGRRGEEQGPSKHSYDLGPQGPSGRPSGGRTERAHTGIDPQEPDSPTSGH
ncbi:hypothetical protein ACFC1R_33855 [Kitasatospora sp. NPDC056138]|uniref:hypothetical protein n=1 Tax=Kitasatospora sp. NPDC056138 TaxID=3345724 RepID=UPI0035DF6463